MIENFLQFVLIPPHRPVVPQNARIIIEVENALTDVSPSPKTALLFLLTVLPPQPKKGAAGRPLN